MKTKKPTGYIFYQGSSMIDGSPIVGIATVSSSNIKTGNMIQTWIIPDNDLTPQENVKKGSDSSVCGNCEHRPIKKDEIPKFKPCYVLVFQAPNAVYKKYKRGGYTYNPEAVSELARDIFIRIGSWGNGSAIPKYVWDGLLKYSKGHTGYDHNWQDRLGRFDPAMMEISMASVETVVQYREAKRLGYRTFRVKEPHEPVLPTEIVCPASEEAGRKVTCSDCRLCGGSLVKAKDIVINAHGRDVKKNKFKGIEIRQVAN